MNLPTSGDTYERLFHLVKDLCPNAAPQSLCRDFELAAFQKMMAEFPTWLLLPPDEESEEADCPSGTDTAL